MTPSTGKINELLVQVETEMGAWFEQDLRRYIWAYGAEKEAQGRKLERAHMRQIIEKILG